MNQIFLYLGYIFFFNIENYQNESDGAAVVEMNESLVDLWGHSERVTDLAWSPHKNGLLASASYDNTAQVSTLRC